MIKQLRPKSYIGPGIVLPLIFLLAVVIYRMPREASIATIEEGGPIENLSAILYIVVAIVMWTLAARGIWREGWAGGVVFLAFAMRELDFHSRFTTKRVLKFTFFTSGSVPWGEKLIAGPILIIILIAAIYLIRKHWRTFFAATKRQEPFTISTIAAFALMPVTKSIDNYKNELHRFLERPFQDEVDHCFFIAEETLELAIPILVLIALWQWRKAARLREGVDRVDEVDRVDNNT